MFRQCFYLLFAVSPAFSQHFSFGITGGVPVSPHSASFPSATIGINPSNANLPPDGYVSLQAANDFYQKPYAVGPSLAIYFPWKLSLETGFLYERFHKDLSAGVTPSRGGGVSFGYFTGVAANAFSFPLLVRRGLSRGPIRPFVEAGATLRHLGAFEGNGAKLDFYLRPASAPFRFETDKAVDVAVTAGAGFHYRLSHLDLIPELRFEHWTAQAQQPVQNRAMLLLTVAFAK